MSRINFDVESPVIILDVEIRGVSEVTTKRMALDTGATYVIIPWKVAEILGYKPELSKEKTTMITASGVESAPIIILKKVSSLGKEATDVKAIVHDLPVRSYVDGLLGLSFLKNFNLHINFKEGYLELD